MRFRNGARSSDPLGLDLLGFHAFPLKGVAFSWLGLHDLGLQLRAFGGSLLGFRGSLGSEVFRDFVFGFGMVMQTISVPCLSCLSSYFS